MTETANLRAILQHACRGDTRLFRNNVGLFETRDGRWVRTGLCNGSSDLIGWTTIDGRAVFTAVEVKTRFGRVTDEQRRFIAAVERAGGIAGVCVTPEDVDALLGRVRAP